MDWPADEVLDAVAARVAENVWGKRDCANATICDEGLW